MKMKFLVNMGAALAMGAASLAVTATPAMARDHYRGYDRGDHYRGYNRANAIIATPTVGIAVATAAVIVAATMARAAPSSVRSPVACSAMRSVAIQGVTAVATAPPARSSAQASALWPAARSIATAKSHRLDAHRAVPLGRPLSCRFAR